MLRWPLALLILLLPVAVLAQRPPAVIPERADAIVERLPKGYAALMPRVKEERAQPVRIEDMLAAAARTGDGRLVARAEALVKRHRAADTRPDLLRAAAYAAQYRHDFDRALELLDRATRADPRDGASRLARAQILMVQGELNRARGECTALALQVDASQGRICIAALLVRRGEFDRAVPLLDRALAQAGDDAELQRHLLVQRAEAASRAGDPAAGAFFRRALARVPGDVRTLAAYSRHLRDTGRPAEAFALLADAPDTDHLRLERALAARAAHRPEAQRLAAELARRYAAARALGSPPDARDEAEFLLNLAGRPAAALERAEHNFSEQRDYEDVDLMHRAALAAGRPQALRPVEAWARSQQLEWPAAATGIARRAAR